MYTIKFEAKIVDGIIKIPLEYEHIYNTHAKVTLMLENDCIIDQHSSSKLQILDFTRNITTCFNDINPVEYQRKIRDAK